MLKFKKTISIIILLGLLLPYFAYYDVPPAHATDFGGGWASATAGWASFAKYVLKEYILDLVARALARRLLTQYLNSMVDKINESGRTGRQPAFALSWRNFLTDAQHRGEDVFRSILGNTVLCPGHGAQIRLVYGAKPGKPLTQNTRVGNLDPYLLRGRCTMPEGWTMDNYRKDFGGNGGWDALVRLSEPQNNFYGSLLMSQAELAAQRAIDSQGDMGEIVAGQGFTGTRADCRGNGASGLCIANKCSNNNIACSNNADCVVQNSEARCTFLGEVTTPSKVLGEASAEYIDSNIGWLISSDEITEVIGNFIGAIITKMVNFRATNQKVCENPGDSSCVTDPNRDRYEACINSCNNQSGNAYAACIEKCSRNAGVEGPGNPISPPPPQPPPPPPPPPPFISGSNVLLSGQSMAPGEFMRSVNDRYSFDLDTSGQLILYDTGTSPSTVLWTSNTSGTPAFLTMAVEGNLILYFNGGATVAWQSATNSPGAYLDLSNTGDLVIYNSGTPITGGVIFQN